MFPAAAAAVARSFARLHELDADEWFDVCRRVRPELTRAEFDAMWADFQARKRDGRLTPAN